MDMQAISEATGLAPGLLKYLGCLLAMWPLSFGHRVVPGGVARQLYAIGVGLALSHYAYGSAGLANLCMSPIATYALCGVLPRKFLGIFVGLASFVHLITCHVANASGAAWSEGNIDFTGSQMILTLKCVAFALNLQDGHKQTELERTLGKEEAAKRLSAHQRESLLLKLPNPLSFLAYVLDPSTVLIGPFLEFREYDEFANGRGVHAGPKPSSVPTVLGGMVSTIALAVAHVLLSNHFPITAFTDATWKARPMWEKLVLVFLVPLQARLKYYFCWTLSHTALKCSGAAFKGGRDWGRGENVQPLRIELATSAVQYPLHWNICTGNWLRHYVYDRQQAHGKRPGFRALLVTQTVSGVWHGLYAGYWLFFLGSAFMLQCSRFLFKITTAAPAPVRPVLNLAHGVLSSMQLNFLAVAFLVLDLHPTLAVWRDLGFFGVVLTALLFLASLVVKVPKPKAHKAS